MTDACAAHGGFYLGSIGGPAARLALDNITKVEVLEYPELGMEAVWKIDVVDFPAFIVVDDKGNDFFEQVRAAGPPPPPLSSSHRRDAGADVGLERHLDERPGSASRLVVALALTSTAAKSVTPTPARAPDAIDDLVGGAEDRRRRPAPAAPSRSSIAR